MCTSRCHVPPHGAGLSGLLCMVASATLVCSGSVAASAVACGGTPSGKGGGVFARKRVLCNPMRHCASVHSVSRSPRLRRSRYGSESKTLTKTRRRRGNGGVENFFAQPTGYVRGPAHTRKKNGASAGLSNHCDIARLYDWTCAESTVSRTVGFWCFSYSVCS